MFLAVLPGLPIAFMLTRKTNDPDLTLRRGIVVSLILAGAIGWLPFGDRIPLGSYLLVLVVASLISLPIAIRLIRDAANSVRLVPGSRIPLIASGAVLLTLAALQLQHPIVDWDAINYYLLGAMDAVLNGHYTTHLSRFVEITAGSTNTLPPAMPSLYALTITLGNVVHSSPGDSIRLISVVFIFGIWLAARKIALRFMPRVWAETSALVALIVPGVLTVVIAVPLLLDLGITFLALHLVDELLAEDISPLSLGFTAAALAIEKIDGLPFAALAFVAFILPRLGSKTRLWGAIALALLLPCAAFALHLLSKSPVPVTFGAIVVTAVLFVLATIRFPRTDTSMPNGLAVALFALGFLPGLLQAVKLTILTGSPAAYYLPSLASHQPLLWHQAVDMIARAQIYTPTQAPGIPNNFGFGLLLWWGFAPPIMLGFIWGIIRSLKRGAAILQLVGIIAIVELAFLTIFGLDDFRHLLPITPLIVIVSVYGFTVLPTTAIGSTLCFCLSVFASVPFAWVGQQRFFSPPMDWLNAISIDQWHSLSTGALITIASYVGLIAGIDLLIIRKCGKYPSDGSSRVSRSLLAVFAVVTGLLWFEPIVATAANPGLLQQRQVVINGQDGGYLLALRLLLDRPHGTTVLTYGSFGTTWFSRGRIRHAELTDASDLETIIPCVRQYRLDCLRRLGIRAAVLPAESTSAHAALRRLLAATNLNDLIGVYSEKLSRSVTVGQWTVLTPRSEQSW